jgi:hypothetical protein
MWFTASVLSAVLAATSPKFMTESPDWPESFKDYCNSIRTELGVGADDPPIDPTRLPSGAQFFTLPVVEKVLGQRVGSAASGSGEGIVWLGFIVEVNRRTKFVRVLESTNPGLNNQAMYMIETSRFVPAWLDGKFVSSCMSMKVSIKLQ